MRLLDRYRIVHDNVDAGSSCQNSELTLLLDDMCSVRDGESCVPAPGFFVTKPLSMGIDCFSAIMFCPSSPKGRCYLSSSIAQPCNPDSTFVVFVRRQM